MNVPKKTSFILSIDPSWTLFLDRDGVINRRLQGDYVKCIEEFEFLPGVVEAIVFFRTIFSRIIVVTNQQGVGKGIMKLEDLQTVHEHMIQCLDAAGAAIDTVLFCTDLNTKPNNCRKPNLHMGLKAKKQFPDIDFNKSMMVGDSGSDLEFGQGLGMKTVYIRYPEATTYLCDLECSSLEDLARLLH